jgi:Zn-dependent M28 family amino/carboxypeptidase
MRSLHLEPTFAGRPPGRLGQCLLAGVLAVSLWVPAAAQTLTVGTADAARYLEHVKALTMREMEGRGNGTQGLTRAARILEEEYRRLGLEPAGTQRFFQAFQVATGARLAGRNEIVEQNGAARKDLTLNDDFVPLSFSSSGEANAPVVFAGYGATAPEFGYDDYAGLDVTGKIVLVLRYEPAGFAARSGNQRLTPHASLVTKAINARNHGARGLVVVNGAPGGSAAVAPGGGEDALMRFGSVSGPADAGILFVQARNRVAQEWLAAAGKSLADAQKGIDGTMRPASFELPTTLRVSMRVSVQTIRATVNNVLAYLPGRSDEYIIIGAHYDHLGYGNQDSLAPSQIGQVHSGADDNASGTAGLLELARMFAPLKGRLSRGILFASFAGEELGLLGSADWVKQPTRPLEKAVAMLNMDMIGRIRDGKVYVGGVGTGSTFETLLAGAQDGSKFQMQYSRGGYSASDHTSFVAQKIPVLFFFSGLHGDYHKPSDTWEKINAPDAAHLLDVIAKIALGLDAAAARPAYVAVTEEPNPHTGVTTGVTTGGGGYGPYFGSIPDFAEPETGVRFSDLQPGSPAARAGLRAGDILVQFGALPIRNLYDFTDALRRSQVGQTVEVTVLRDGMRLTVSVTLEQRR